MVDLKTAGTKGIAVAVIDKESEEQMRGFGLGKFKKEKVMVEQGSMLVLRNSNNADVKVNFSITPKSKEILKQPAGRVKFTLRNNSDKSIPLIIPTVMNPNLSPMSNSGVTLKMGQEIYFRAKGKKQILLVVDDTIQKDDVIKVDELLLARKKELGIK